MGQWHEGVAGTQPLTPSLLGYDTVTAAPQLPMKYHLAITQEREHGRDIGKSLRLKTSVFWCIKWGDHTPTPEFMGGLPETPALAHTHTHCQI